MFCFIDSSSNVLHGDPLADNIAGNTDDPRAIESTYVTCTFLFRTYRRLQKILTGENFGEFGDLLQIRQSFICQLLVISEKARGWA